MNRTIPYNGYTVFVRDYGQGFPVIFLHGYLESSLIWESFAEGLIGAGRLVLIDLPGHGETKIRGEVFTMEFMADVVRSVLDKLAIKKCILIGHSMGGYVSLAILKKYPDRLQAFSLFHSHPLADSSETKVNRKREMNLVLDGKKELIYNVNIPKAFATSNLEKFKKDVEFAREIARCTPDNGIIAVLKGMMTRPDSCNLLRKCPIPLLWILGEGDNYIDHRTMIETVNLPGSESITLLKNSGHMGFMEERETSLGIIIEFILSNQ